MSDQMDKIVKTFKTFAQIPSLMGANLSANGLAVDSVWSQRNLERGKITKFSKTFLIDEHANKVACSQPIDVTTEVMSNISPSERYRAVLRVLGEKDCRKQFLEIWTHQNVEFVVDLGALNVHGDVYTDVEFGSFQWSPDESKVMYVAEKRKPETEPFYLRKASGKDSNEKSDIVKGEEYLFRQDWGEQMVGRRQSVVAYFDLNTDNVEIFEGFPDDTFPAQPIWAPDGSYIVGVAYTTYPRKLGLIYCSNRPSFIFVLDFKKNFRAISTQKKSVCSPRFSLDGETLVWMERKVGGPHQSCARLVKKSLPFTETRDDGPEIVVDIVKESIVISEGRVFHGLYNFGFAKRCWASGRRLLITTNQTTTVNSYVIDIDTGSITELEYDNGSQFILDVYNDTVLVNRRNYMHQDQLSLARLPEKGKESILDYMELSEPRPIQHLQDYCCKYLKLKRNSGDVVDTFYAIYLGPSAGEDRTVPLVVWPHGGPHAAFANFAFLEASFFTAFGFALLFVNYRGSIGAGQASVDFLLGKIGESDTSDCVFATQEALRRFTWLDPKRLGLTGGSHGGFIVTHLSGQYPDMFKVVVARNPVIDVASLSTTSDIPDWSFVEGGGREYTQEGAPSEEMLVAMRRASPIVHAHKVKAPTLLQVGSKDLRVPCQQSADYYYRLKANNVLVRQNLYEDNHPLSAVPHEMDNIINAFLWIRRHIES